MRRSMLATGLAALVARSPSLARACSQCMCGTPFPSDVLGGVVPMQLTYGFEDRYLSKENGLEEQPGVEEEREHRIGAFGLWRATNRIALLGRLPYNFKEITETPDGSPAVKQRDQGPGDAELHLLGGFLADRHGAHGRGRGPDSVPAVAERHPDRAHDRPSRGHDEPLSLFTQRV